MRVDKFLWTVRLFKTRSKAAKACENGLVKINQALINKPSKTIGIGDTVQIRAIPIWKSFKVLDIPKSRLGAKLVPDHLNEITDLDDLKLLESIQKENRMLRLQGKLGRPTKKDRRDLDDFFQ